jgi:flagellin
MLAIANNMMAENAARYLGKSYDALATSVQRLSSGLRINSASDDAAGMAVSQSMKADVTVLDQGARNAQDGISMLQTMEGAMGTMDNALVRMKQLAEQASTGSYTSAQRVIMNNEFEQMAAEVDRIAKSTQFNGIGMLNTSPDASDVTVRFGTGTNDAIAISRSDMTESGLGITVGTAGEQATSDHGVAAVGSGAFLTTAGVSGTNSATLHIQFTGPSSTTEDKIDVTLDGGKSYTLQNVVDLINAKSQNNGNDANGNSKNYTMASTVYDAGSNTYQLKISSHTSTMTGVTMTMDTDAAASVSGAYTVATGQTASVLTGGSGTVNGDTLMKAAAGTGVNILSTTNAGAALTAVTNAISLQDTARAKFGYMVNRLQSTGEVLGIQKENLQTAQSRIADVDVATEMATLTRNQVLAQAGTAMLAQANSIPQMALTLLK